VTERSEGLIVLAVGVAVIALAQLGTPHRAPPLYDGVVVEEPYRYLSPPPGAAGGPKSYSSTEPVQGGQSAELVAATPESPPQAQLVAAAGAFQLPPGSTALTVSIQPVAPASSPPDLVLVSNVYRFSATDQAGAPLKPAAEVTLLLRASTADPNPATVRWNESAWQEVPSEHEIAGMLSARVTELGDFAVVVRRSSGPFGLDPVVLAAASFTAVASVAVLLLLGTRLRSRGARPSEATAAHRSSGRGKPRRKHRRQ
jgi:hypothetical protein